MRAVAPLLLPGSPRAADAVPSASTSCLRIVRGSTIPGRPRTDPRIPAWISWPNVKASALRIALAASEVLRPQILCPFQQHPLQLISRLPLTASTMVNEQAGGALAQAIRSAEQSESARIARRTRAKGGAAHGCAIPRRSVRQTNEVRGTASAARGRQRQSAPSLRHHLRT